MTSLRGSEWEIITGDCREVMATLEPASVDAVVCDPPYGLEFMGKEWDRFDAAPRRVQGTGGTEAPFAAHAVALTPARNRGFQDWCEAWGAEALRVLKPGGHLLAFGGTRTYHRLACALEDVGFDLRDTLMWMYGSGFPKSLDVSKALDRAAGVEREVLRERSYVLTDGGGYSGNLNTSKPRSASSEITAPATPDAMKWDGWGTALKPAWEPIILARKPLAGTVAANVVEFGTGALNIDGCRVGWGAGGDRSAARKARGFSEAAKKALGGVVASESATGFSGDVVGADSSKGRWPSNVFLSHLPECVQGVEAWECAAGCPVVMVDEQSGTSRSTGGSGERSGLIDGEVYGAFSGNNNGASAGGFGDVGGASRFFYCAKTSRAERDAGLDALPLRPAEKWDPTSAKGREHAEAGWSQGRNHHPTVKPVEVMRWLVRLVTPPNGTVLDPFTGSGSTGCAAMLERRRFIGIELDADYVTIAAARIAWWREHPEGVEPDAAIAASRARKIVADAGQLDLLAVPDEGERGGDNGP